MQYLAFATRKSQKRTTAGLKEKRDFVSFVPTLSNMNIWAEESGFLFRKLLRPHASCMCELAGRDRLKDSIYPCSCNVCKACFSSVPPSHLLCPYIARCLMTGPALPRKLTALGWAETFHVKFVKVAHLPQDPAQHSTERLWSSHALHCCWDAQWSGKDCVTRHFYFWQRLLFPSNVEKCWFSSQKRVPSLLDSKNPWTDGFAFPRMRLAVRQNMPPSNEGRAVR